MTDLDSQAITRQLVKALRGRRSQLSLSRRLGFSTNVLYAWESGRSAPMVTQFLHMAERSGIDTRQATSRFYVKPPLWLTTLKEYPSRSGVAAFLKNQRGQMSLVDLAERSGISRFTLSRWFKGSAEPRLPDFLTILEHTTRRVTDWVSLFADPELLPALEQTWKRDQAVRAATYELPWTQAVLRALELRAYAELPEHRPGWLATRLGIEPSAEQRALELLASTGQIQWLGEKWRVLSEGAVDLRRDPTAAKTQRAFWTSVAAARAKKAEGMFAYNVCGISESDLRKLTQMQREFLQAARLLIAKSHPVERVVLLQTQIFALDENAASGAPPRSG